MQATQAVSAAALAKTPGVHAWHAVEAVALLYRPDEHARQMVADDVL